MRTSAVSEENWFARSKSTLLASMSVLRLPGSASRGLVLSHFDQFLTFGCAHVQKRRKWFFPNAHSSERRLRGELVCSLENHVARVDVGIALHSGCASRGLVLSHFDQFLTFGCAARAKTSEMVLSGCALERAPFQRRIDLLARKARCSRRCRYCVSPVAHHASPFSAISTNF